ncbi:MAG: diguanylate cyclase [Acidimicrobiales bacterium]
MKETVDRREGDITHRLSLAMGGLVGFGLLGALLVGLQLFQFRSEDGQSLTSTTGVSWLILFVLMTAVVVTATAGWLLLVRPLKGRLDAIIGAAVTLAAGEELDAINDADEDEIGEVARSLDRLSESIRINSVEQRSSEIELRRQAAFDGLTGAANRASLMAELEETLLDPKLADHSALLSIDLDRFKELNDTFGHQAGDEALKIVTDRVKQAVKASDIVARMGGDEFLVLLKNVGPAEVAEVVARLRASMSREATIGGHRHKLHFSIGTTQIGHGVDSEFVLREVDIAMYQDKERGKKLRAAKKASSKEEVIDVLGDGHLEVRFDPVFDIVTGLVLGAEAQPYWLGTTGSVLEPAKFRTMIDETPQGLAFDQAALSQALGNLADWSTESLLPENFVLLYAPSLASLGEPNFPAWLVTLLKKHRLPVSIVQLVIGKTGVETDPAGLRDLCRVGIKTTLEDVGLLALQDDRLGQLDMSLAVLSSRRVRDFSRNPLARPAADSLVALARNAGLAVIAAGVDSPEDFVEVSDLGVRFALGSHLSPLVAAKDFARGLSAQIDQPHAEIPAA